MNFRSAEEMMKNFKDKDDSWSEIQEDNARVGSRYVNHSPYKQQQQQQYDFQGISIPIFISTSIFCIKYYLILYLSFAWFVEIFVGI